MNLTTILSDVYGNVSPETVLPIKVAGKEALADITAAYEQFLDPGVRQKMYGFHKPSHRGLFHPLDASTRILEEVYTKSPWTTHDIDSFLFSLITFQNEKSFYLTGAFISALVNIHHKDTHQKKYILPVEHLEIPFEYMCCGNSGADILVNGNCGENFGQDMISGTIICNGSVGNRVGSGLKSGTILIEKDTKGGIGAKMTDGCIRIKGRIVGYTAEDILAIEPFHFYEPYLQEVLGGEIYHGSRRVFPK